MAHFRRCAFPVSSTQAKKTRQGLNSLSYFRAHEKMVHWTITRFLIFMLVKKQSIQGLNSLSQFRAHEKMTLWGHFFNLRLRMVKEP